MLISNMYVIKLAKQYQISGNLVIMNFQIIGVFIKPKFGYYFDFRLLIYNFCSGFINY